MILSALVFILVSVLLLQVIVFVLKKKKAALLTTSVVVLLYSVLGVEMFLRVVVSQVMPELEYQYFSMVRSEAYPETFEIGLTNGSKLVDFRSKNFSVRGTNIVLLGGSTMHGHGFTNESGSYISCLMQKKLGKGYQVMNFARPGYNSRDEMLLLDELLSLDIPVHCVITLTGWNDLNLYSPDRIIGERWNDKYYRVTDLIDKWRTRSLAKGSYTFRFLLHKMFGLSQNWLVHNMKYRPEHEKLIESFLRNIKECQELCDEKGIRYYVLLQPTTILIDDTIELSNEWSIPRQYTGVLKRQYSEV
ncbi:hypothetical protein ACFLQR_03655, partial [Verrucomicrobiota bacterium]